ncbi:Nse1 non-SMC component of SMC5-6 complex-domain-containing protein [Aspergillus filifer]
MSNRRDYTDANRAFLQALMARSTITFEEARPILAAILSVHGNESVSEEDITEPDLSNFINAANASISPFDLEIRSTLPQHELHDHSNESYTPERVYALVNTTSDGLTQLATTYTPDEISFVKRVLDKMFEVNNTRICEALVVSSIEALQQSKVSGVDRRESGMTQATPTQGQSTQGGGAAQSLTMTQAEGVLKQLVEEGWFEKSRKEFYSLSPRGLLELRGWLVATYNDEDGGRNQKIKFCAACRDIITVGQRCGNRDCPGRLHDHCMRNIFRVQKAEQCPVCRSPWPGDKFVGERAVAAQNRRASNARQSLANGTATQSSQLSQVTDEEVDAASESD